MRVKLPVSALLAVCVLMSTVSLVGIFGSRKLSSNALVGVFDGQIGRFFLGPGCVFKCLFFGGR